MSVKDELFGARILVIEDDQLLAATIASFLLQANAVANGPFPSHRAAMDVLDVRLPDMALLDVNILEGTSFELAR
jgi:DNA-binding response OmpR family regulator